MTTTSRPLTASGAATGPVTAAGTVATATAHAKTILLGEHAVVYGGPAIALPVHALTLTASVQHATGPLRVDSILYRGVLADAPDALRAPGTALVEALAAVGLPTRDLTVRIDGEIPAQRGLGSSAAVAAAISAAVARAAGVTLDPQRHFDLVQSAERVAHGTPSGLDARSVISPAPVWFRGGEVRRLRMALSGVFVIADTGVTGGTRSAVSDVRALREADPVRVNETLAHIDAHTAAAVAELAADDREGLGRRMFAVHELLQRLTVSSPELDVLVTAARRAGALGAKLTGGGRGGCVLALAADDADARRVAAALREAGAIATWMLRPEDMAA